MKTEKEKIRKELEKEMDNGNITGDYLNGYLEGLEAGKIEAISNFAEKIKKKIMNINKNTSLRGFTIQNKRFIEIINKLVEEQFSGESND